MKNASILNSTLAALAAALLMAVAPGASGADRPYKVLHVMSYQSPMPWADGQYAAFQEAMRGVPVEYRVFRMDANRPGASPEWKEQKAREARELIDSWKPDLVYAADDEAQARVSRYYVNKDVPFVVSGVHNDPASYGFVGSKNVAVVLARMHVVDSVRLLRAIVPGAKRIVLLSDQLPISMSLGERIREQVRQLPDVEIVGWEAMTTYDAYQRAVRLYQHKADAIWFLALFGLNDKQGKTVNRRDLAKWTAENNRLPDLGFWEERMQLGTLVGVAVSPREQGLAAGRIARAILVEGKSPASFAIQPTSKGIPMVSVARARVLGLKVTSSVLLSAEVFDKFDWDKK